ncbi:MAG: hypothetical protein WBV46_13600 [Terriglobales bacterium]|jgi:hypothetical protein
MTLISNKRLLFAGILCFGLLAMTARTATDPDLWWHLRTGQWIVETGHVPHADPFSFTRGGMPWVSHEWLSEIIFYELWAHPGRGALIVFSSLITTVGFMLLYARCPGKPHWAAALTVLGAAASAFSWGARPQMFTFTLAALLLWLLEQAEARPRLLLWIPALFLLWLNLHAGFALGPALLALYVVGLIFECATGTTPWFETRPIATRVLLITLACLAIVPLNPSGAQLYHYPLDTLRSTGMRTFIVEWFSPNFHQLLYIPFLLIVLLLVVALANSQSPVKGRTLLPLLFIAAAAFDAVRHIPIFILLAIPVIAAATASAQTSPLAQPVTVRRRKPAMLYAVAVVLLAFFAIVRWIDLARAQPDREAELFPQKAVTFLLTTPQAERLFAFYDWGGYTIWKLDSKYRVFADGRADLYGNGLLRQSIQTVAQLHQGWEQVLDHWDVQTILIPPGSALAQALALDPGWRAPYRDSQAVVFVRAPPTRPDYRTESFNNMKKCLLDPSGICETREHTGKGSP